MTNYNEKLDEILDKFFEVPYPDYNMGILPDEDGYDAVQERRNYEENYARDEAKQAIIRLVVQILEEAKEQLPTSEQLTTKYGYHMPEKMYGYKLGLHDAREAIDEFEQNLLKELEEL